VFVIADHPHRPGGQAIHVVSKAFRSKSVDGQAIFGSSQRTAMTIDTVR
jgi:hypothetical protein